ncbi:MAG: carbonic anhydrase family protein [Betaproteobacteria bacterium]
MKKYLRIILEVLLAMLLVGAAAMAYWNYAGKKHISYELAEVTEQVDEAKEALEKAEEEMKELKENIEKLETSVRQIDSLKAAFANGIVLQDVETSYKGQKTLSAERQVGIAALRLLTNGVNDPETVAAFQKSLEMSEWGKNLQTVCAAQNALAAAGQKVQVLSDCKTPEKDQHGGKEKSAKNAHDVHWGYEGDNGPEHWGASFPICGKGKKQSPLNIVGPFEKSKDVLSVSYKEGPLKILNNGHTIQVNVEPGSKLTIGKEEFDLLQFHFHRPSEEQVDGKNAAMVAHFVHKSKEGKLSVIGVLLNEGKDSAAIKTLWANLPPKEGEEYLPAKVAFNPGTMLPKDLGFYNYEGSLTTPPCTEGVNFYILKTPADISKAQLAKFPFKMNARPVQNLNGRKISAG